MLDQPYSDLEKNGSKPASRKVVTYYVGHSQKLVKLPPGSEALWPSQSPYERPLKARYTKAGMIASGGIRSKIIPTFKAHTLDRACADVLHMAQL